MADLDRGGGQLASRSFWSLTARYLEVMAPTKISVPLDQELVRRVRNADLVPSGLSDSDVVERVLTHYLGRKALEDARALGPLDPDEADRIAVEEVRAVRRQEAAAVIWAQMTERPPLLTSRRADLPHAADAVLEKAMFEVKLRGLRGQTVKRDFALAAPSRGQPLRFVETLQPA